MISAKSTIEPDNQKEPRGTGYKEISERDSQIFELFRQGMTLQEVGNEFKLSRERVRQIVNSTIQRLTKNESITKGIEIDKDVFVEDISRRREKIKESKKLTAKPLAKPKEKRWSMYYAACRKCGTTTIPHVRKGLCEECLGIFRDKRREEIIGKHSFKCDACGKSRADAKYEFKRDLYITKQKDVLCRGCYRNKMGKLLGGHRLYEWSRTYPKCKSCGTTTIPHVKRGLCENCSSFLSDRQREKIIADHGSKCDRCQTGREEAKRYQGRDLYVTTNNNVYCKNCFQGTARSRFIKK